MNENLKKQLDSLPKSEEDGKGPAPRNAAGYSYAKIGTITRGNGKSQVVSLTM